MGRVTHIYLRPSSRTAVREVDVAEARSNAGLEGDHARGGNRQITLMEQEAWQAALGELGRDGLPPRGRRANVVVTDFSLAAAIGHRIQVGECVVDVVAELRPCKLMEDVAPGLMPALEPECRGGAYGRVLKSGRIDVGAAVTLLSDEADEAAAG